jgi:hypothetical protein
MQRKKIRYTALIRKNDKQLYLISDIVCMFVLSALYSAIFRRAVITNLLLSMW